MDRRGDMPTGKRAERSPGRRAEEPRYPPGAHLPRHLPPHGPDVFQVELQGSSIKARRSQPAKLVAVPDGALPASAVSATGYLPSSMGGYSSVSRQCTPYSIASQHPASAFSPSTLNSRQGEDNRVPLQTQMSPGPGTPRHLVLASAGSMSETTQRNPSRFRASMASPLSSIGPNLSPLSTPATTSVYGIRPRTAEEEPRMPQLLEMRLQPPPPSARFSSLDKIIISSADRFPGHLADGLMRFDAVHVMDSAEAFQLPPMKEKPTLTPALLDDLRQQRQPLTMDMLGSNDVVIMNKPLAKGTFRQAATGRRALTQPEAPKLPESFGGGLMQELPDDTPKGIVTGEDAVIYIISSGGAQGLVLYCNYARDPEGPFAPYDLRVVGRHQVEPEHFAISYGGVTHILPDEDTLVTPLHEWIRQKRLYSLVHLLPFFGKHTLSKAFWKWKVGIKAKHFAAMQHKLRTDLFKAHGLFGPSLRRVAAAVASVRLDGSHLWRQDPITRCWKLDEAPPAPEGEEAQQTEKKRPLATQLGHMGSTGTSYTVTDFAAMREAVHEQAEAALNEVVEVIKAETGTVGTAIVDELNAAFPNAPTERELRAARFALPGKDKWKASSISQQQADKQKKEARQERSLHNADLMGRFMRLCDVIMVDGLLDLAREALHEIVSQVQTYRKYGMISVVGDLEATRSNSLAPGVCTSCKIVFEPSLVTIKGTGAKVVDDVLSVISLTPRPLYLPELLEYYDPFSHEKPPQALSVMELLESELRPERLKQSLIDRITIDYQAMLDNPSTVTYSQSAVAYAFAAGWDRLEYEERKPSPSDLAADLSTMRQWFSDLRYTKTTIIHGLVHLDCQRLRSILMEPVPKTITGMSGMLHATFVHHATEVVSFLKDVVRRLKKRPSDYNSFSLYMTEIGPHLSAAGDGRKESLERVATAKALLYLLQPDLQEEEKAQLEMEQQMTESSAASDDGQAQRLSRDSNKSTHSPAPQPVTSVQLSLTAEQETLTAAELLSRSLVSLSQRPRKATLGTDYSFQDDLDEEDSKCNMDMQVKLFTDICKCYREYEGSCREAAGFVTGYKPVMSNAITQAALQMERTVENLMIRARGALLTNVDSLASHALAELRGILGELGDCKKESDSFQEHQKMFGEVPLKKIATAIDGARSMIVLRVGLWEEYAAWQGLTDNLDEVNVLEGETFNREELVVALERFDKGINLLEQLHVDDNVLNSATVTPAEAAFVGRLRNLVVEWQSYRTLIEQLCDPAMKQHHMNLLLLEMGLVSELPKPAAKSRAQSGTKNTGGSKNAPLSGISFRERMGMTDDRIAYEKESPSLQQRVTFMQVLKKAYATQEAKGIVREMWIMASQELLLSSSIEELRNSWGKLYFVFSSKRVHGLHPFANLKALGKVLADSKALLDAMAKSRYLPGVMRKYDEVEKLLAGLLDRVESVEICQNLWLFISRLLQRPEAAEFPDMAARFEKVSNSWKMLGLFLQEGRHSLVAACSGLDPALQSVPDLKKSLEDLDRDSLALLDSLRARFPRFYFAADRDVLHALANSSSPGEFSSSLLSAVFPGVKKLQVVRTNRTKQAEADKEPSEEVEIVSVIGQGDEELVLTLPVHVTHQTRLSKMMADLEEALRLSVAEHTHKCLSACAVMKGPDWVASFPLQSILLVDAIVWTDSVTDSLKASIDGDRSGLRQLVEQSSLRLETMARQVRGVAASHSPPPATQQALQTVQDSADRPAEVEVSTAAPNWTRTAVIRGFQALIQAGVLHRDIVEGLIAQQITEPTDFEWQRQMRYYWDRDLSTCLVNVADTSSRYGFEYQGATEDGLGAMTIAMCPPLLGAIAGLEANRVLSMVQSPTAGISCRAMAKAVAGAFGRPFYPITCTTDTDCRATASFLRALIECSAWGALQCCNSLLPEAVSQLAQQIYTMRQELMQDVEQVTIGGIDVDVPRGFMELAPSVALFLDVGVCPSADMRQDTALANATRWLSRSLTVHSMSIQLPMEAGLRMMGLANSKEAARAFALLFKTAAQHFDGVCGSLFGLTAARSVLLEMQESGVEGDAFDHLVRASEVVLCSLVPPRHEDTMRSLIRRILTIRRGPASTLPTSNGARSSTPSQPHSLPNAANAATPVSVPDLRVRLREIASEIHSHAQSQAFQSSFHKEAVADAAVQMLKGMLANQVTVIVGPPGVGKTTVRRCLVEAMQLMDVEVEEHVLYPSTMTVPELMGACGTASNNDYGLLGRALQRRWKQFQNGVPVWSGTSLAKGQAVLSPARLKARHDRQDRLLDDDAVGDAEEMQSPSGRQAEDRDLSHTADTCRNLSAFVSSSAIEIEVEAAAPDGKLQENSWLVLDGPLVGPQAAVLLPLLTGGQLSQSGDGGVFFIPRGMQVLWETDSLAGMSPADAVSVHVVHLGNRLLEQPGKAAERILMTELPRMFPTVEFDEVTLGKLPMFFASVVHIWQRFNDVSTEEVGGGLTARTTRAACTVCDLFVQVLRDNIHTMAPKHHDRLAKMAFAFSTLWGLGARLTTDKQRQRLETTMRHNWAGTFPDVDLPEGSFWDYRLGYRSCTWVAWQEDIDEMLSSRPSQQDTKTVGVELKGLALHPLHADEGEMHVVVPTAHTVSRQHVMTLLMAAGHSPLLAGPPISGKTLLLRHLLTICPLLRPEKVHSMWVTFHATSSPWTMQAELQETLIEVNHSLLRPAIGRVALMVVDDMHVPVQAPEDCASTGDLLHRHPRVLEWVRQLADSRGFVDINNGSRVKVPLLQMLCSSNTSHLVDGTPRASKRLLRHFELVGMYDCGNKSHGTAFIDQQSQAAIFPPFKDARLILEGIAHRLLLSTRDAIPHFYVSEAAKEMADATLEGAKVLLSMALAPVPATAGGVLVLSEIQPRGPADSLQQTGSTSRLHSLTFRRLERIVQRARSVLCRQAAAAEESGTTTAVLRKQVGYVWLHEASRELADGLPAPWSKTLQARLVQVASGAFSAFNDGVVTYPPRCKGMSRIDWANLLAEASAIEGWQLGPADQEAAYARMIQHSAVAGQENYRDRRNSHSQSGYSDSDDESLGSPAAVISHANSHRSSLVSGLRGGSVDLRRGLRAISDPQQAWGAMTRKRLLQPKWSTSVLCVQSCLQRSFELGNMMLVGPQCTGRTSAARLAAQQQDMEAVVLHSKPSLAAKSTPSTAGLLDQMKAALLEHSKTGRQVAVIVPEELTNDDSAMGFIQDLLTGWRQAVALCGSLDRWPAEGAEPADAQPMPDPLETARLAKQRSIKILRSATFANMDLASIGAAAADTAPADSEPASHAATLDVQDHRPPIMAAAVSSAASAALTSMKVETSAAPVVQERRKTQISTKEADTVGRLKQTFQAEGESSILSIKNIGADGSIMFGADHSRAVRLLRVHADTLDPPDARRRGRMAAGIVWAANYQRDSNNRRWELKGNMAVRHLRQCLRCVLVVSPERQRQMALRFPALVRSLQVTRFGEVEKSHVELSTAQLLRSHALVALLPPQLKAAHEFTSRPHKTFGNQEPHNLHRERDVFEIARSRTFGPQAREFPAKDPASMSAIEGELHGNVKYSKKLRAEKDSANHNRKPGEQRGDASEDTHADSEQQLDEEIQAEGLPPGSTSAKRMSKAIVSLHHIAQKAYDAYALRMGITCSAPVSKIQEVVHLLDPILSQHRKLLSNMQASVRITLEKLKVMEIAESHCSVEVDTAAPQLEKAADATANLLVMLTDKQRRTDELQAALRGDEKKLRDAQQEALQMKQKAEKDLAAVQYEYDEAAEKILNLKDEDIDELRSYHSPPGLVQKVMEAVCILFGVPIDWRSAKSLLAGNIGVNQELGGRHKSQFKSEVVNYDVERVDDALLNKLQYFKNNPSFNTAAVAQVSRAAKSLCSWVLAVESHAAMKRQYAKAHGDADQALAAIEESHIRHATLSQELNDARHEQDKVATEYSKAKDNESHLKAVMEQQRTRSGRCEQLRGALAVSRLHWQQRLADMEDETDQLQGNAVLAACSVVYLGPFPEEGRKEIVRAWTAELVGTWRLRCHPNFQLSTFMALRDRSGRYIPRKVILDSLRKDNMFMLSLTQQIPLLVDPDGEGVASLRALRPGLVWHTIGLHEPNSIVRSLEAVAAGGRVLLQVRERALDLRQLAVLASSYQDLIQGSTEFRADGQRLFLFVRSRLLDFSPMVYELFNVIQFAVGVEGLEQRTLAVVMNRLYPRIEQQKRQTIISKATQTPAIEELDTKILRFISKAQSAFWDDNVLAETIVSNALLVDSLRAEVERCDQTLADISKLESRWRGVAQLAGELFATLTQLAVREPAFSMNWGTFLALLRRALREQGIQPSSAIEVHEMKQDAMNAANHSRGSPKAVEDIAIAALYHNIARRLPIALTRCFGVTFALRVLERLSHLSPEEKVFFTGITCMPLAMEDLRHAGIATGDRHPLFAVRKGDASLENSVAAGPAEVSETALARAASVASALSAPSIKNLADLFVAGSPVPDSKLAVPAAPRHQSNAAASALPSALAPAISSSATFGEGGPARPTAASLSVGPEGGPLPWALSTTKLLSDSSTGARAADFAHEQTHVPLFGGGNVMPGRPDPHSPRWPSKALIADLRLLEGSYPAAGVFDGIADAVEQDPETWRAACLAPCPPEALPGPWQAPTVERPMSAPMNARGALDAEEDQTTPRASISPPRTARCFVEESPGASPPQKCIEREEVRSLSDFQKLVLLWVLCPERFATCSDWLVERMVGPMKLESQAMRLQAVLADVPSSVPILLHTCHGEEPALAIQQTASCIGAGAENPFMTGSVLQSLQAARGIESNEQYRSEVIVVSLGQGQTCEADEALATALSFGHWLVVLNCHTDTDWCSRATAKLADTAAGAIAPGFRMWLCTRSSCLRNIQPSLLSDMVLTALEPPSTAANAMMRAFASVSLDQVSGPIAAGHPEADLWRSHVFGLAAAMVLLSHQDGAKQPLLFRDGDFQKGVELLHRIITSIGGTRFLDYAALQKLLRRLVFDPAMPGAMQMQLSGNLLSRFLTRDVLSVHYPIYKRQAKGEASGYGVLPNSGLADVCKFLRVVLPSSAVGHRLVGTHPMMSFLDEAPQTIGLLQHLRESWSPKSKCAGQPTRANEGPSVPFMHPDRLAIWSNELMNAVGVASSLLGGYKEKVAKGNSSRSISITQEHMLLQAMLVEAQHIHRVLRTASTDLQGILQSVSSSAGPPEFVVKVLDRLSAGLVPPHWVPQGVLGHGGSRLQAEGPSLPAWRAAVQARLEFLRGYRDLPGGQPAVWNFSLLAFPGAVLSAIRCSFASQNSINPSAVGFRTEVVKPTSEFPEPVEPPSSGIYLGGLHLQGAAWDAETISLARLRDGVLFSPMPPVWVIPVHRAALQLDDPKRARTTFDCPVVLTPDNADIPNSSVLLLRMPTRLPPEELLRARVSSVVSPFGTARTTGAPPP